MAERAVQVRVNGELLALEDEVEPGALLGEMRRQGWAIVEIVADGQEVDAEHFSCMSSRSLQRVDVTATPPTEPTDAPPGESSVGSNRPGEPAPERGAPRPERVTDRDRERLAERLLDTLPRFRSEAERLGDAFGRGEWRESLGNLTQYLEELETAVQGFSLVLDLTTGIGPYLERLPALLGSLSTAVRRRSWVEVSDALLYEVEPFIAEWMEEVSARDRTDEEATEERDRASPGPP